MDIVFVVGVGRSGTSALTRVLSLCGAQLPTRVLRVGDGNPSGYWEPEVAIKRNDQFLEAIGSSYHDPSLIVREAPRELRVRHDRNIQTFLRDLPAADLVVIKDPRISGLVEPWEKACRKLGHTPKYVHVFRSPTDVASSFGKRYGILPEHCLALWLKYNLVPERTTRKASRVFVSYRELMADWRGIVQRCNEALGLKLHIDADVDGFLSTDLEHHRATELEDPTPGRWVQRTYSELQKAERMGSIDTDEMDRIFEEYTAADQFFGRTHRSYLEHFVRTKGGAAA